MDKSAHTQLESPAAQSGFNDMYSRPAGEAVLEAPVRQALDHTPYANTNAGTFGYLDPVEASGAHFAEEEFAAAAPAERVRGASLAKLELRDKEAIAGVAKQERPMSAGAQIAQVNRLSPNNLKLSGFNSRAETLDVGVDREVYSAAPEYSILIPWMTCRGRLRASSAPSGMRGVASPVTSQPSGTVTRKNTRRRES
jgi:hypothetical protein